MIVIGHKGFFHVGLFIGAVLLALIASDCALYHSYEASRPETIRKTESRLTDAGFSTIKVDTSDKVGLMENLRPFEIRSYAAQSGEVYWYYDPDICACVYEGHQGEFGRYQMAQRQESDIAQYAAESNDQQIASLNALNGTFFPPPIFWVGGYAPSPYFIGGERDGDAGEEHGSRGGREGEGGEEHGGGGDHDGDAGEEHGGGADHGGGGGEGHSGGGGEGHGGGGGGHGH